MAQTKLRCVWVLVDFVTKAADCEDVVRPHFLSEIANVDIDNVATWVVIKTPNSIKK